MQIVCPVTLGNLFNHIFTCLMHSSSGPMEWGVDVTYYNYYYYYLFIIIVDMIFGLWLWGCLFL